jgi:acyl-coenzyme A thioesterase 13
MATAGIDTIGDEIEAGYVIMPSTDGPTFSDYIGPYYVRENAMELRDGQLHMAFRVQATHLNILSICHGGVIASFLDDLMGFAAYMQVAPSDVVTSDLATRYVSTASLHDWVTGSAQILNTSRSVIIIEGRLHVGDKLIAFASGAWRRLTPRGQQ